MTKKALLILFLLFTVISFNMTDKSPVYPSLFTKEFPLSTPGIFLSSTLGMRRLAADIVWIQSLQYYSRVGRIPDSTVVNGEKKLFPELIHYWQQVIRLDPLFISAHLTGPITLGWNLERTEEAIKLLDESIETIEKMNTLLDEKELLESEIEHLLMVGDKRNLEEVKWKLLTLKTVLIFLEEGEVGEASRELESIAFKENAPEEIRIMLAQIYQQEKSYDEALKMWLYINNTTRCDSVKGLSARKIQKLKKAIFLN